MSHFEIFKRKEQALKLFEMLNVGNMNHWRRRQGLSFWYNQKSFELPQTEHEKYQKKIELKEKKKNVRNVKLSIKSFVRL